MTNAEHAARRSSRVNFVLQQGFRDASASTCDLRYPGLMFQPRVLGIVILIGVVLQSWFLFAALAIVLAWSALLPRWNPFDAVYNALIAGGPRRPELPPAPGPRRFAQGLAGTLSAIIAVALLADWRGVAWGVEAFLLAAVAALVLGKFCFGSYLFLHLRGDGDYASRTAPWASRE